MYENHTISYDHFKDEECNHLIASQSLAHKGSKRLVLKVKDDTIRYVVHTIKPDGVEGIIELPLGTLLPAAIDKYNKVSIV